MTDEEVKSDHPQFAGSVKGTIHEAFIACRDALAKQEQGASRSASVEGSWVNELGSILLIQTVNEQDGTFKGTYTNNTPGAESEFPLTGQIDPQPGQNESVAIRFNVLWQNSTIKTAWNGFYFGGNTITAIWTLTSTPRRVSDLWGATTVNEDTFKRLPR